MGPPWGSLGLMGSAWGDHSHAKGPVGQCGTPLGADEGLWGQLGALGGRLGPVGQARPLQGSDRVGHCPLSVESRSFLLANSGAFPKGRAAEQTEILPWPPGKARKALAGREEAPDVVVLFCRCPGQTEKGERCRHVARGGFTGVHAEPETDLNPCRHRQFSAASYVQELSELFGAICALIVP